MLHISVKKVDLELNGGGLKFQKFELRKAYIFERVNLLRLGSLHYPLGLLKYLTPMLEQNFRLPRNSLFLVS